MSRAAARPGRGPVRPRIAISTSNQHRRDSLQRIDALTGLNYTQAIVAVGGLPLLLPNLDPELVDGYLDGADGVLLSGGGDLDPHLFEQPPHPSLGYVDPPRDRFELALYRAARARGLPVLGICRGIQTINVAEGGSLHQHLPALPHTQQHGQSDLTGTPLHAAALEPGSALARAYDATRIRVNSYHHQAVDRLGANLRVTARADDGVVEAIENANGSFVLGVQWHPEMSFQAHPEHLAPFRAFLEAVAARGSMVEGRG